MIEDKKQLNILLVGNGAREDAYARRIRQSSRTGNFYVTVGNAGINQLADPLDVGPEDIPGIIEAVREYEIDLVVSGPEKPYAMGLRDEMERAFKDGSKHTEVFGPTKAAIQIESSKIWSAGFNWRHRIPQPTFVYNNLPRSLKFWVGRQKWQGFACKVDELDGGKGVIVTDTAEEAYEVIDDFMVRKIHGPNVGNKMIVQEKLEGEERTVMAWVDRKGNYDFFPPSADHKLLNGKNTGGMGVYAPADISLTDWNIIHNHIFRPAIDGLAKEGIPFDGILYAGLMMTSDGPKVLEWNGRGGDPEIEAVLPLYGDDFDIVEAMLKCIRGEVRFGTFPYRRDRHNTTVVLASAGYPDSPEVGKTVSFTRNVENSHAEVFHGGTRRTETGDIITTSGRVLAISATGETPEKSQDLTYSAIESIYFDGMQFVDDIGE